MKWENGNDDMFFGASPKIFEFAKQLRHKLTSAEERLWKYLSKKKLGVKFRRQHPLNGFIADFYCHQLKLIIEIDGGVHAEFQQKDYDIARTEELGKFGIKVIRFRNDEIMSDIENVLKRIKEEIVQTQSSILA